MLSFKKSELALRPRAARDPSAANENARVGSPALADYWKRALDSGGQGVWDYDLRTGEKSYSDVWYQIRGTEPGKVPYQSDEEWLASVHPEDRSLAAERTSALNAGTLRKVHFEYRERHFNGSWIWIMCRGEAMEWDKANRPYRFIGTDTDITRMKKSEEDLVEVSRRLSLALSTGRIGVWQYDVASDTVSWDPELCQIYGIPFTPNRQPRDVWERAIHPQDKDFVLQQARVALAQKQDIELKYRIVRPDGETRHIRSRVGHRSDSADAKVLIGVNWDASPDTEHTRALEIANREAFERNEELEAARRAMEYSALHDELTGLPNRRFLQQAYDNSLKRRVRRGRRIAVLHADLDRFKQINDALGHAAGDHVLVEVAGILKDCVGTVGHVARVGGDEFAVLVDDAPSNLALAELANSIIERCAAPISFNGEPCRYGVSIGIAVSERSHADHKALFVNADMALYRAKREGRARHCFFTQSLRVAAVNDKQRNDELLSALERREFTCFYQPQFSATTLDLAGLEALVRWRHPTKGLLSPHEFLPIAERLQVLHEVDRLVLFTAAKDLEKWTRSGFRIPRLSVNISAGRLHDPCLIHDIESLSLGQTKLSLELVESNLLDDPDGAISNRVNEIRQTRTEVEVDDFGTGNASIISLLRIRPDRLKIDRAFVASALSSPQQRRLLQSIIDIGRMQGIAVLAEGVESREDVPVLRSMGCDELQGFALARPMDSTALLRVLRSRQFSRSFSSLAKAVLQQLADDHLERDYTRFCK